MRYDIRHQPIPGYLVQKAIIMSPQAQGIENELILLTSDLSSCAPSRISEYNSFLLNTTVLQILGSI